MDSAGEIISNNNIHKYSARKKSLVHMKVAMEMFEAA